MKKTWILIGIMMLLFTSYQIVTTYAKYTATATGTAQKQAGAWIIKVNDDSITSANGAVQTFDIDSLTYPGSPNVAANKIAPGASGYFEIEIDPTGTSVAVRYDVTLDTSGLNALDAIKFSSAKRVVNNTEVATGITKTAANTYTGVISLSDVQSGTPTTLRFYITWEDEGTSGGDTNDSQIGLIQQSTIGLPVDVVVSQYMGETIVSVE